MLDLLNYNTSVMIYGIDVPFYILIALVGLFGFIFLDWGRPPGPPQPPKPRPR